MISVLRMAGVLCCLVLAVSVCRQPSMAAQDVAGVADESDAVCRTPSVIAPLALAGAGGSQVAAPVTLVLDPDGNPEPAPRLLGNDLALGWRYTAPASRQAHDGWSYEVFITNLAWDRNGHPFSMGRCGPNGHELLLQRERPLILFNLVAAVEWDATPEYLRDLEQAFGSASAYLYDLSDGQMALGQVTLVDNALQGGSNVMPDTAVWRDHADIRFSSANTICPAHLPPDMTGSNKVISVGPFWRYDGTLTSSNPWSKLDGYRTLIHELGHHLLGLYDEYGEDEFCAVRRGNMPEIDDVTASAMSWQYQATEFSARPPYALNGRPVAPWPLWSCACENTTHYRKTGHSTWETIDRLFSDPTVTASSIHSSHVPRWEIVTPTERGHVMPGPDNPPLGFPWPDVTTHAFVDSHCGQNESACAPLRKVCVSNFATICGDSSISTVRVLRRDDGSVALGVLDHAGCADVLGASLDDQIVIKCGDARAAVSITANMPAFQTVAFADTQTQVVAADPGVAGLEANLLAGPPASSHWAASFLRGVQTINANCRQLGPDLFGPLLDFPSTPEALITMLDVRTGEIGPLDLTDTLSLSQGATGELGVAPWQRIAWWQQALSGPGIQGAESRNVFLSVPVLDRAFQQQSNFDCRLIDTGVASTLSTPDGIWNARIPPQPDNIEVAIESRSTWLLPTRAEYTSLGQGFEIVASSPLATPIEVAYTANCGPGSGTRRLAVVNAQTGETIMPAPSVAGDPAKFQVDKLGTYDLVVLTE